MATLGFTPSEAQPNLRGDSRRGVGWVSHSAPRCGKRFMNTDPYSLQRFVDAQKNTYERALGELHSGRKESHWMWFIFPQFRGLGESEMSKTYAIHSREEAVAYLKHELLGPRLTACTRAVIDIENRSIQQIFGYPDWMKFHSSMTLFKEVAVHNDIFDQALDRYFAGDLDGLTLKLLRS